MASRSRDLTRGNLYSQIFVFSFPLILTNLLQVLFSMVDAAIVGRFAGSHALGAVGSTTTLNFLYLGFLLGLGSAVNVLVAKYYGAKDDRSLQEMVRTSAMVSLIIGLVVWYLIRAKKKGVKCIGCPESGSCSGSSISSEGSVSSAPVLSSACVDNSIFTASVV